MFSLGQGTSSHNAHTDRGTSLVTSGGTSCPQSVVMRKPPLQFSHIIYGKINTHPSGNFSSSAMVKYHLSRKVETMLPTSRHQSRRLRLHLRKAVLRRLLFIHCYQNGLLLVFRINGRSPKTST